MVITDVDDLKSLEFAIIENVQRNDLNAIEEARGYQRLIEEFSYDQEKVAQFIGKSRSHIANFLRLLNLPEAVLQLIETQKLSAGHAKILVGLDNSEFVANKIIEKKLSVRQSENLVKIFKTKKHSPKPLRDTNLQALETSIREKIGLNVLIKNKKNNIEQAISASKPPVFWKDKPLVTQQIRSWKKDHLKNLIYKTNEIELLIKKNSTIAKNILSDFIINNSRKANN